MDFQFDSYIQMLLDADVTQFHEDIDIKHNNRVWHALAKYGLKAVTPYPALTDKPLDVHFSYMDKNLCIISGFGCMMKQK